MDFGDFDFNVSPMNPLLIRKSYFPFKYQSIKILLVGLETNGWLLLFLFFRVLTWETLTRLETKVKVLDHL